MKLLLSLTLALALAGAAHAQGPGAGFKPIATPVDRNAIPLYPGVAPGSESATQVETWAQAPGDRVARNVVRPTLVPVLPAKGKATGAAVIVVPGGGGVVLSMDREGYMVAKRLADHGVAAFILKYRLRPTPADWGDLARAAPMPAPGALAASGPPRPPPTTFPQALADGQEALRMVRRRAKEWGVDPHRVGMTGFSAGAGVVMAVTVADDPTARPDFIAPIYGGFRSVTLPKTPPPMFTAVASDDALMNPGAGFPLVQDWLKAGAPVELHMFEKGGHGFGAAIKGTTSDMWMDEFFLWLKMRGLLKAAA